MKRILQIILIALVFSSCSNIIIPYYTTVDKITSVNPGMSKEKVVATLGIEPYEIFHGIEGGCEIHQFKYKHKEVGHGTLNSYSNTSGAEKFVDPSNVYVYYRDGKVESLVTDEGKKGGSMVLSFAQELQDACEGKEIVIEPIFGCMDKKALNYNKKATMQRNEGVSESETVLSIGDCEYCICDYKPNKKYDAKKNCGERCIPIAKPKKDEKIKTEIEIMGADCTLCDLAEKPNAKINIDLTHKSGRLWNRKFRFNDYISKVLDGFTVKKVKSNNNNNTN
jgi:hypothetical protein